jgi:Uncharacterized protein conserved in bacteria (DUF2188)
VFDRKSDAVERARAQAKRERTELVVKDQHGRIAEKDSYGSEPRSIRG